MSKHKRSHFVIPAMTPEQLLAVQERRRSNAAGTHADRRLKRTRTRAAGKRVALRDWA
jgi:hypothetical protein